MGSITHPMLLGAYEDGLPCTTDLSHQHVFIVGATGSGKSVLLNIVLSELAAAGDVVPWGIDFKGGAELGPWRDCLDRIATPQEAEQLLQAAVAVLEARAARGQKHWPASPRGRSSRSSSTSTPSWSAPAPRRSPWRNPSPTAGGRSA
jgi:DNA segregation ATPase FtsK/SpoIIIE, S-DNA-T family